MLTREQVEDVLGRCEDQRVIEIIGTGATFAEVVEAKRWTSGYKRTLGDEGALRVSVVTRLCDILRTDEPDWQER